MKKNKSPVFIWDNFLQLNYAEFVEKTVKLLQNKKNDINCVNELGETALHLCCKDGLIDKFYTLIYMGADPTITTKEKNTILHYAAFYSKDIALTQEIAKKYVSPASVNIYGKTPMNICTSEQDIIFFENWALLNKIDKNLAKNNKDNAFLTYSSLTESNGLRNSMVLDKLKKNHNEKNNDFSPTLSQHTNLHNNNKINEISDNKSTNKNVEPQPYLICQTI